MHYSLQFVERLIGSIRRKLLDHTFVWTVTDPENKPRDYRVYYNKCRTHFGGNGATPVEKSGGKIISINQYCWDKHYRASIRLPIAACTSFSQETVAMNRQVRGH